MDAQDELIDPDHRVDRARVERRVVDWKERIDQLHRDILDWLPAGWTSERVGGVRFDEELMRKFGVPSEQLPVLVLRSSDQQARLEPRGLWIIGANGRVDLKRADSHFLIVDRARAFERPDWQVAPIERRLDQKHLDAAVLREMLA